MTHLPHLRYLTHLTRMSRMTRIFTGKQRERRAFTEGSQWHEASRFFAPLSLLTDTVFKLNHSDSSEPGAVNKFAAAEAKTVNKSSNIAKTLPPVKAVLMPMKPPTVARIASTASGTHIEGGDSCGVCVPCP